jgi:hypothetical protein
MLPNAEIEFSRIVALDQIGVTGLNYSIEAKSEECSLLATRFDLKAIHNLKADFVLESAEEKNCYRINGVVVAEVIQFCISTLRDVPAPVKATFKILLRPSVANDLQKEFEIDIDEEADTEYYSTPFIDLGETAAQYLYLNLDPFPRIDDAPSQIPDEREKPFNRFAEALQTALKNKK